MKLIRILALALFLLVALTVLAACQPGQATPSPAGEEVAPLPAKERLRVATTTSLYDTGLWGYLEPMFEQRYSVELDVIYAGTGKALEFARRGDVDVLTIHDKARELQFIADGEGLKRYHIAYNYFLVVGPEADPAGIKSMSPEDAFKQLMERGQAGPEVVKFISRGDNSGTHAKEQQIWKSAGYEYEDVRKSGPWYVEAGQGMGPTLIMASEMSGYTLTDIGTFLAFSGRTELVPLVEQGDVLLNVYSVITLNPEKHPGNSVRMADSLVEFLTSAEIQKLIGAYGVKEYGRQLFIPAAGLDL